MVSFDKKGRKTNTLKKNAQFCQKGARKRHFFKKVCEFDKNMVKHTTFLIEPKS